MRLQLLERRIDQSDVEGARSLQQVGQVGAVVLGPDRKGKQAIEQGGPAGRPLVQGQAPAAGLGQDGQQPRTGGGLQDLVARPDLGGEHRERA